MSFGDAEYAGKRKKTRREVFLDEMEQVVPWKSLLDLIEPCYPVAGRGRHPYPLETMLRVHLMQNWFGLSDPAMEEALYEITPMRTFAGLTLTKAIPDETTILNFRHLLEEYELAPEILRRVNAYLTRKGLLLKRGSIVDATIIAAPSSTKNAEGERDPEMHQTCSHAVCTVESVDGATAVIGDDSTSMSAVDEMRAGNDRKRVMSRRDHGLRIKRDCAESTSRIQSPGASAHDLFIPSLEGALCAFRSFEGSGQRIYAAPFILIVPVEEDRRSVGILEFLFGLECISEDFGGDEIRAEAR